MNYRLMCSIVLAAACARTTDQPEQRSATHRPAADSIVAQFSRTPIVAVAEHHRSRQVHRFLRELISHPRFSDQVDDIVVEFGSAYYQPVVDRYIRGEEVPLPELREAWRGSGQFLVWDSPLYEQFFAAVRARNRNQPPDRQLRVLLGDPPINWATVHNGEDYLKFIERDQFFANLVEREVLEKGRRALLVIGAQHLMRQGPLDSSNAARRPGVGQLIGEKYPEKLFVVWTLPPSPDQAAAVALDSVRGFLRIMGSPQEGESFSRLVSKGASVRRVVGRDTTWVPLADLPWPPINQVIDAVLYLGSDSTTVDPDPDIYQDPTYQGELRRRAAILEQAYGFEFLSGLEALLPSKDSVPDN